MIKRIVITGNGQLAAELKPLLIKTFPKALITTHSRLSLDITDYVRTSQLLRRLKPDCVINTAAYNRVDDAERPQGREAAVAVNADAVAHLSSLCASLGAKLVHYSTDYVFSGPPYLPDWKEVDAIHPRSVYAVTKAVGERWVLQYPGNLVFRVCGLYGIADWHRKEHKAFVHKIIKNAQSLGTVRVVDDQICTPSYAADVADGTVWALFQELTGLYHMTNRGSCSWYEFSREIIGLTGINAVVQPIDTSIRLNVAPRPRCSVLNCSKLDAQGIALRHWRLALAHYIVNVFQKSTTNSSGRYV